MSDVSKVEQDRIDSLMKLCDEHNKTLRVSLEKNTEFVKQVSELMSVRLHQITQKMASLNAKFDAVHTNNQKLMDKIREKLDEIDAEEMEANREFDDLRRKVIIVKRQKRGIGLVRSVGMKLYDYGIYLLSCVGLHEPVKKPPIRDSKRCKNIPQVSRSEHVLTLVFPKKPAAAPNPNPNDNVAKKSQ